LWLKVTSVPESNSSWTVQTIERISWNKTRSDFYENLDAAVIAQRVYAGEWTVFERHVSSYEAILCYYSVVGGSMNIKNK